MFLTDETDRLRRREFPVEFGNPSYGRPYNFMFRPRRVTPKLWLLPPPWGSRELRALDGVPPPLDWRGIYPRCWKRPEDKAFKAYERFWKDLAKERPNAFTSDGALHQVGGVGHPWQDPVEVDCVRYADDDYHNQPMEKAWFDLVRSRDAPPG